ncbi:hypothetical protein LTR53_010652, partial [Teratosphaeriaceae sp. CCFEE 6253]
AAAVQSFELDADLARGLLDVSSPPTVVLEPLQIDRLRCAIDYAWLSDTDRTERPERPPSSDFQTGGGSWTPFAGYEDGMAAFAMPGDNMDLGFPHAFDEDHFPGGFIGT